MKEEFLTHTPGRAEKIAAGLGFAAAAAGLCAAVWAWLRPADFEALRWPYPCIFLSMTGYYCPSCGGTRAVKALLRGHIAESFRWHAAVPVTAGFVLLFEGLYLLCRLSRGRIPALRWRNGWLLLFAAVFLLNWIGRNLFLFLGG